MVENTLNPSGLPQDLGTLRTVMAADRTLMAWIRTSLSMLSSNSPRMSCGSTSRHLSRPRKIVFRLMGEKQIESFRLSMLVWPFGPSGGVRFGRKYKRRPRSR